MRRDGQDNRPFVKAAFLLPVMALLAGILMYFAWRSYEEKMEILYVTLEQQSGGMAPVDIVTGLLKGEIVTDGSDAEQQLEQYGFLKSYENHYKKSLYRSWTVIGVIFCLLYVGFLTLLYWMDHRQRLLRKKELLWLQRQVTVLRDRASESFQHSEGNVAANAGIKSSDDRFTAGHTDNKMTRMSFGRNRTKNVIWQNRMRISAVNIWMTDRTYWRNMMRTWGGFCWSLPHWRTASLCFAGRRGLSGRRRRLL